MNEVCWKLKESLNQWSGVNIMVIERNFMVSNLLLTTNDGSLTSSKITSIGIVKVTICKGMVFKHVPPLMGLLGLVVTIGCFLGLSPKVNYPCDGSNFTYTKEGGSYLKSEKTIL
jgi:hypothetical protein